MLRPVSRRRPTNRGALAWTPPIVIGGGGEKRTLRIAAKFAQHWNLSFVTPDVFLKKKGILLAHCESVGRDSS